MLDTQLATNECICGEYSIVDIATFPWVAGYSFQGLTLDNHPHLKRWFESIQARPVIIKGMAVPA